MNIGGEIQPELVLLDANLFTKEAWSGVPKSRSKWPAAKFVALVEDEQQRHLAETAGVDLVLNQGIPAAKLIGQIEELISGDGPRDPEAPTVENDF
jgi:hypothetical protein